MGRNSLGPSNISLQNTLYSSCFRLQQNDMSWLGSAGTPTKSFSLCKFINFEGAAPWLIEGRTGPTEASGTDYSINTYFKQTGGTSGYLYYLKLFNGSNCSITLSNPGTGPGYALNPFYASTSASDGVIGYPYIWNSAQQSYFNLTAAATTGNTFDGWYTAASGGSAITTSTNYNVYYNFSYIVDNMAWYARTSSSPSYWSTTGGYGVSASAACFHLGVVILFIFRGQLLILVQ